MTDTASSTPAAPAPPIAVATVNRQRRFSAAWLVPLAALIVVGLIIAQALEHRGRDIRIRFQSGDGIRENDPVMYRGVEVGRVRRVSLARDMSAVLVAVGLRRDADSVAVDGSRFWIVRPEVSLTRVSGLETLVGPRYLQVEPGPVPGPGAPTISDFIGLDRAPAGADRSWLGTGLASAPGDGGLGIVLEAARIGSLRVGSPVLYRGVRVGTVMAADMRADARGVDLSVLIERDYVRLVRTNTRFWNVGGIGLDFGIVGGFSFKAESIESVISGGIELATPTKAGERVQNGARFKLEQEAGKDWSEWSPDLSG